MKRIVKAVGALIGGVTGGVVATVLHAGGVDLVPEVASAIAVLLAAVGTYLAPKNTIDP